MGNYQSVEDNEEICCRICAYMELRSNRNKQFPKEIIHQGCVFAYYSTQTLSIGTSFHADDYTQTFLEEFPELFEILRLFRKEVLIPWPHSNVAIIHIQPQYDQFSVYFQKTVLAEVLRREGPEAREYREPEQFHEGPFCVPFLDPFITRPKVSKSSKSQPLKTRSPKTLTKSPSKNKKVGLDRQGNAELVKEMNAQKSKQMEKSAEDREKSIKANKFHRRYKKTKRNVRV